MAEISGTDGCMDTPIDECITAQQKAQDAIVSESNSLTNQKLGAVVEQVEPDTYFPTHDFYIVKDTFNANIFALCLDDTLGIPVGNFCVTTVDERRLIELHHSTLLSKETAEQLYNAIMESSIDTQSELGITIDGNTGGTTLDIKRVTVSASPSLNEDKLAAPENAHDAW